MTPNLYLETLVKKKREVLLEAGLQMGLQKELEKGEASLRNIPLHEDTVHQAPCGHPAGLINSTTLKEGTMTGIRIIQDILSGPHQEAGVLRGTGEGVVAGALLEIVAKVRLKGKRI